MDLDAYLSALNPEQMAAMTETEGYVRVIAGAGSGKTRALTARFAYLTGVLGVPASDILCVTFTNKAAGEMRRRIHELCGDADTGLICTFHGFCVTVLQEEIHAVGYPSGFMVLDNTDIDAMLAVIYEERGLTLRDMTYSHARDMFEIRKQRTEPEYTELLFSLSVDELRQKYLSATEPKDILFYGYLWQQKKCYGVDYNDLLTFTHAIFNTHPEIAAKWQQRLEYIMIDEFQDIDRPQYDLMAALSSGHKNLFVVGDPDQTVYTWRGADVAFLLNFDKDFGGTKTILMNTNYRSTPEILRCANSLISVNKKRMEKSLTAVKESGPMPRYAYCKTAAAEAAELADTLLELNAEGVKFSEMAVLYRAHYVSREIEESFMKKEIPYEIFSGVRFFDRAEIKDALSYLRFAAFRDDLSLARIINKPRRNIGISRMQRLNTYAEENRCSLFTALQNLAETEYFRGTGAGKLLRYADEWTAAAQHMPVSELLTKILEESGYEKDLRTQGANVRLDNLAELKQAIWQFETTCGEETDIGAYMRHIALFTNAEADTGADKVRLMTVHAAKGLEFPVVFLASMEEDVFPSKKTFTAEAMEEERRLAFVAMTRAKDKLYVSSSAGRNLDGSFRRISRFVYDSNTANYTLAHPLPKDCAPFTQVTDTAADPDSAADRLKPGTGIRHPVLGDGTVLDYDEKLNAYVIQFDRLNTPRKIGVNIPLEIK